VADFNKVILMGRLTRDCEMRYTQSGSAVANGCIAVNRHWRDNRGTRQKDVVFVDFVVWGVGAQNMIDYTSKGSQIHIEGRLIADRWQQSDGTERSKLKVSVESFQFLGGKSRSGVSAGSTGNQEEDQDSYDSDESVPF